MAPGFKRPLLGKIGMRCNRGMTTAVDFLCWGKKPNLPVGGGRRRDEGSFARCEFAGDRLTLFGLESVSIGDHTGGVARKRVGCESVDEGHRA